MAYESAQDLQKLWDEEHLGHVPEPKNPPLTVRTIQWGSSTNYRLEKQESNGVYTYKLYEVSGFNGSGSNSEALRGTFTSDCGNLSFKCKAIVASLYHLYIEMPAGKFVNVVEGSYFSSGIYVDGTLRIDETMTVNDHVFTSGYNGRSVISSDGKLVYGVALFTAEEGHNTITDSSGNTVTLTGGGACGLSPMGCFVPISGSQTITTRDGSGNLVTSYEFSNDATYLKFGGNYYYAKDFPFGVLDVDAYPSEQDMAGIYALDFKSLTQAGRVLSLAAPISGKKTMYTSDGTMNGTIYCSISGNGTDGYTMEVKDEFAEFLGNVDTIDLSGWPATSLKIQGNTVFREKKFELSDSFIVSYANAASDLMLTRQASGKLTANLSGGDTITVEGYGTFALSGGTVTLTYDLETGMVRNSSLSDSSISLTMTNTAGKKAIFGNKACKGCMDAKGDYHLLTYGGRVTLDKGARLHVDGNVYTAETVDTIFTRGNGYGGQAGSIHQGSAKLGNESYIRVGDFIYQAKSADTVIAYGESRGKLLAGCARLDVRKEVIPSIDVGSLGIVTAQQGHIDVSSDGKISGLDAGDRFTIVDADGQSNPISVNVTAEGATASDGYVEYILKQGIQLSEVSLQMVAGGKEVFPEAQWKPATGLDFTATEGVQMLDLGSDSIADAVHLSDIPRRKIAAIDSPAKLDNGHYYLLYEAANKALSIKKAADTTTWAEGPLDCRITVDFYAVDGTFTINGRAYTLLASEATKFVCDGTTSYLAAGMAAIAEHATVNVANEGAALKSAITATTGSVNVAVFNGTYTISDLDDGDAVTIDSVTYTYVADTNILTSDSKAYLLKSPAQGEKATAAFTIADGVDAIGETLYAGSLDNLSAVITKIEGAAAGSKFFFDAKGKQQTSEVGAVYTLTVDAQSTAYSLVSSATNTPLTIDAAGVTGLTADFSAAGKQTLLIDNAASVAGTLGADDVIFLKGENDNTGLALISGSFGITTAHNIKVGTVGYLSNITFANGSTMTVTGDGVISGLKAGDAFTISDDAAGTVNSAKVVVIDRTITINGISYSGNLADASINMLADGVESPTGMVIIAMGFDLASNDKQWLYLGATATADKIAADLPRMSSEDLTGGCLIADHYYLEYDGESKTISVKQAQNASSFKESADAVYTGAITIDVAALATTVGTSPAILNLAHDTLTAQNAVKVNIVNANSDKLTIEGVTADDTINGVSMAGANSSILTVVGKNGGLTSIEGLEAGASLGGTEATRLPAGVEVRTKVTGRKVTVNGKEFHLMGSGTKTIRATGIGSYLTAGKVFIDSSGNGDIPAVEVGDGSGKTSTISALSKADGDYDSAFQVSATGQSTYKIEDIDNGERFTVDGVTYTAGENNTLFMGEGAAQRLYFLTETGAVSFTMDKGVDKPVESSAILSIGSLAEFHRNVTSAADGSYYFNSYGAQQLESSDAAYTLTKTTTAGKAAYTLASTGNASGKAVNIDLTGLKVTALDLSSGSNTETVTVGTDTVISDGTFGSGDVIKNAAGSKMATVENGQGIVQAKGGNILLKAGVFAGGDSTKSVSVATGETAPVVIGNITFGTASAAAAGSYTSAAAVSFASGQISVAAAETNPVAVTAGNVTYTTKAATLTTLAQENGSAVLVEGSLVLDPSEAIAVKGVGTLTNNGSIAISVTGDGKILAADGGALPTNSSFTTSDGTYTVKYALSADAKEIKVMQTVEGKKKTAIYKAADTIAVTMQEGAGAFATGDFTSLNELSGVSTDLADITEIKLPPLKEISTMATFDALGQETEEASEIAITVNGAARPKTVTVSKAVDASVPIDLTDTEASITDKTGTAVFTINDAALSGKSFSVKDSIVTETGNLVTVSSGDLKTSGKDGNFSLPGGSSLTTTGNGTLTINGEKITLTGSSNGVTYMADKTKPNKISAIKGMDDGEAVTFASTFTGGEITVDGTAFTAITSRNGITFRQQDNAVQVTLDQKGETVTVDGFTFAVESTSHSGLTVYKDTRGSQVAGLRNGDKVTVTKDGLTTTYTAYDGKLVIGYTGGDGKATTKSYTLGSEKSFTATWDGSAANAPVSTGDAGLSLTPGSATVGETDLNSVVNGTQLDSHGNITTDDSKTAATIETTDSSLTYRAKSDSGKHELGIADTNGVDWNIDTSEASGRTQVGAGTSDDPVNNAVNVTTGSGRSEVAVYSNADSRITGGSGNLTATRGGKGQS